MNFCPPELQTKLNPTLPKRRPQTPQYSFGVTLLDCFPSALADSADTQAQIEALVMRCIGPWAKRPTSAALYEELERIYNGYMDRKRHNRRN